MATKPSDYPRVYDPDNPMAHSDGRVRVHRLVAAEMLGRPLHPDEHVHHQDGNPRNNDPDNLIVTTLAEHTRTHWQNGDYN